MFGDITITKGEEYMRVKLLCGELKENFRFSCFLFLSVDLTMK